MKQYIFALGIAIMSMASPGISIAEELATKETITIVADNWCPYNCEPDSDRPGTMIEIAQKAFARHNIEIKYSLMPWTRAIEEARKNTHTAIVGAAHKDAPDFIFPEASQGMMLNTFFVKTGNDWKFEDISSLQNVSLGCIADYFYNEELNAYIDAHKTEPKFIQILSGDNALESNVKKLVAGRVDTVVEGAAVMNYYLGQNGLKDQVISAGAFPSSPDANIFIAFSPQHPKAKEYADILSKETQAMRKSGELKEILDRYNVSDWE